MPTTEHRSCNVRRLRANDVATLQSLNAVFADAFDDHAHYASQPPSPEYLQGLLSRDSFFALAATLSDNVAGGLVAYELLKFEPERSEIYLSEEPAITVFSYPGNGLPRLLTNRKWGGRV